MHVDSTASRNLARGREINTYKTKIFNQIGRGTSSICNKEQSIEGI